MLPRLWGLQFVTTSTQKSKSQIFVRLFEHWMLLRCGVLLQHRYRSGFFGGRLVHLGIRMWVLQLFWVQIWA